MKTHRKGPSKPGWGRPSREQKTKRQVRRLARREPAPARWDVNIDTVTPRGPDLSPHCHTSTGEVKARSALAAYRKARRLTLRDVNAIWPTRPNHKDVGIYLDFLLLPVVERFSDKPEDRWPNGRGRLTDGYIDHTPEVLRALGLPTLEELDERASEFARKWRQRAEESR